MSGKEGKVVGSRGEWWVVVQLLLFVAIAVAPRSIPALPVWPEGLQVIATPIGVVALLVGMVLAGGGVFSLGNNLSPFPRPKDDSELVEHGVYRMVRHPIYSGVLFLAFGWSLLQASTATLLFTIVLGIFFDRKSAREEVWLAQKFTAYQNYQTRVRKLIPWLY
ncbi:MAG: isoprenylcysteine carboxylmethyltransferase family protein [Chloroflexota bacterium]